MKTNSEKKSVIKTEKHTDKKTDWEFYAQFAIIVVLAGILIYSYSGGQRTGNSIGSGGIGIVSASSVIPKGVPDVYGKELGVSYDDVSPNNPKLTQDAINKLASYEDGDLNSVQMSRYIKIGSSISCEYCCGAQALIFSNGQRACGCAHSYAMRGLAKYLLINHPDMTDIQILNELGKWKVLFFPGIHEQKAKALEANGIDYKNETVGYIYLASNIYRGIENQATSSSGSGSQMVGGC